MRQIPKVLALFCATLASAPASANPLGSIATQTDQFGQVDLSSGAFTQLGVSGMTLAGLAVGPSGQLYAGAADTGNLYRVDPTSGALTLVGSGAINYLSMLSSSAGLFAVGGVNAPGAALSLYKIDPATGAATLVGPTGLAISTTVIDTLGGGPSIGSPTLYFSFGPSFSADDLYSLDPVTGAATLIGNTGIDGLAAELYQGGVLYGGSNWQGTTQIDSIVTLNPMTGAGTFVADLTGGASRFAGLGPAAVPEPSTWAMMLAGLAAILAVRRRVSPRITGLRGLRGLR